MITSKANKIQDNLNHLIDVHNSIDALVKQFKASKLKGYSTHQISKMIAKEYGSYFYYDITFDYLLNNRGLK
tara:strand:+ start:132 stop:347 length:216 start_codon:yes stop_codon:yes gene_type:complete